MTTGNAPPIEEQIAKIKSLVQAYEFGNVNAGLFTAILASLEKLAALEKPVPVEPVGEVTDCGISAVIYKSAMLDDGDVLYSQNSIDALKSALQRAQEEKIFAETMLKDYRGAFTMQQERAEKAEANLKAAEENVSDLMAENAMLTAKDFKENPLAGGHAVRAAEGWLPAAGESPAFKQWADSEYGDVRPVWVDALKKAFNAGTEKAEAINRRMVELLKDPTVQMCDAGQKIIQSGIDDPHCIFTNMTAELLKEVEK